MNILFVTGMFAKNRRDTAMGGMAKAVYMSAKGMQQRGHFVRILTVDDCDKRWKYRGIEVISVRGRHIWEKKSNGAMLVDVLKRETKIEYIIQKLNKENIIDIIQYTGWFGVGLMHFSTIPSVMRVSSWTKFQLVDCYPESRINVLHMIEKLAAKRMNAIFAPSQVTAKAIEGDIGKKVYVFETPYMPEVIVENQSVLNNKIGDKRYILFFGRMSIDKGMYVIRDILRDVLKKWPDLYVVFAGPATINDGIRIERELLMGAGEFADRVIFLGNLTKNKLLPIIKMADLVLMPSLRDNLPNACAEAMAQGKIVIGTDGSSLEQFIEDGYNGFLAEIDNSNSLYEKIEQAFELSEQQKKVMENNARYRVEELNPDVYFEKVEMLYYKVIQL